MNRRGFVSGLAVFILVGQPGQAQTAQDQILRQLRDQGYSNIRARRTFLGRVRILADRRDGSREIVLNPSTGAIMRDYVDRDDSGVTESDRGSRRASDRSGIRDRESEKEDDKGGSGSSGSGKDGSGNSGSGSSGSGNSGSGGSGSGNSGSGNSGSGNSGSGSSGSGSSGSGNGGDDHGGDDGGGDDGGGGGGGDDGGKDD